MSVCWMTCMESFKKSQLAFVLVMLLTSGEFLAQMQDRAALQQALIAQKAAVEANPTAFSNQTRDVAFLDNALPQDICYLQYDPASWTQLTSFTTSGTGGGPLDDGSSAPVALPFQFDFYGELLSSVYINVNGNVSFDESYWEFSSTGFPISGFKMVAPFWADVDLRGSGQIWYKINANSIYINWVNVGYYNSQSDLLNTFQLVLSDGTDPLIGIGNNVAFHYGDMNWTTGSASGGTAGYGGTPATVGANYGNAGDYFTLGRFDRPGADYISSTASNGVDYLDGQCAQFSVAGNQNLAPIAFGIPSNNLLELCPNQGATYTLSFASPEANQITHTEISGIFEGFNLISNTDGESSTVTFSLEGSVAPGDYVVTFAATDNHPTNPLTTTVDLTIRVNYELCPCQPSLTVSCPADILVECGQEYNQDITGIPGISGNFCNDTLAVYWEDALISCTPCGKVISRTWIITMGNFTEVCTQIITSQDTQGPEFLNLESEVYVQCLEDANVIQDLIAVDACSGDVSVENWSSQTGEIESVCVATTAMGPGVDWAIWLPTLSSSSGANFVFNSEGGHFDQFADGTAHLHGTVVNTINNSEEFVVDLWFENKADWSMWSGQERNYKNDLLLACADENHTDWTYYEMVGGFSTLTGAGALEGTELALYHMPASLYFGFQIGVGANNKNCEFGMSGWFTYDGFAGAQHISGHGDVNVDLACQPNLESDCVHHTSFTQLYRAVDGCGNPTIVSQTINVNDTTAPVFSNCPDSFTTDCSIEGIPVADNLEAIDNCSGDVAIIYLGEVSEGNACYTTLTRTWSATDLCGNRSECVQTITVVDTTAPALNNLPEAEITAECDAVPAAAEVTISDNCDLNPTLVYNEERIDGDCSSNYTLIRTWSGFDQCENSTEVFTQTIHVEDTTGPSFGNYQVYTHVQCDQVFDTIPATDNCGSVNVEVIEEYHQSGGCLGVLQRRYRATDNCGNSTEVEQFISLMDTTAPVASNPAEDLTIECGTEVPSYNPGFTDNCGGDVSVEINSDIQTSDCLQVITETYTATDYCGNSSTVVRVITISDTTSPSFVNFPEDASVSCENGVPSAVMPSTDDNCDEDIAVSFSDSIVDGLCPQAYTIIRTFTATDDCGNVATQVQTIHILDETAPSFEEQEMSFTYECNSDIPVVTPTAQDNCGEVSLSYMDSEMEGNSCLTVFSRIWTATDECGNSSEFSQTISIVDTTAPTISGESQIDRPCDDYEGEYITVNDICSEYSVSFTDEVVSGSCAGNIIRRYVATDNCGNESPEFIQIIHLTDAVAPVIETSSDDFTIECGVLYNVEAATFADNCDDELDVVSDMTSVTEGCTTVVTYTWTATDNCGNTASASTVVTIIDTTNPYFTSLPENITVNCDEAIPGFGEYAAGDNCDSDVTIEVAEERIDGNCAQSYTLVRTYRATDNCGNQAVESRYVYIVDEQAPSFDEQGASFTYECGEEIAVVEPIASDNCGEVSLSYIDSELEGNSCQGVITRTWTASDECGNNSTFNQYISIVDTQAPVVNEYAIEVEMPCDNISNEITISASDCNEVIITFVDEHVSGSCAGRIIRSYTVSDACGNVTSGMTQQIINLVDATAPAAEVAPVDAIVECGDEIPAYSPIWNDNCANSEDLTLSNSQEITEDICTTVIEQSWTAVDPCGNSTTVSRTITIVDNTAPLFTFVPENEDRDCSAEDIVAPAYAEDLCSDVTITHSDSIINGVCESSYIIVRTYTASDVCGNSASHVQTISVSDSSAPLWGENTTSFVYECGSDVDAVTPMAFDNCSEFAVTYTDGASVTLGCTIAFERTWIATDACGNESEPFVQYITFEDTTEPMIEGCPSDLVLNCNDEVPAASEVSAFDTCDDAVQLYYEETFVGDAPAEGSIADCNLITPVRPAGNPCGYPADWAMAMFGMTSANRFYAVDGGSLVQYPDNTIHLTATMRSTTNPSNGWNVDVWFNGGMDWSAWSSQSFPTSFKADCGGVDANYANWHYYLLTPGSHAELTGFGNFTGSMLNLVHAPANNYFGFQLGDGANNYNAADNGFGGWFSYNGVFRNNPEAPLSNISGSGDFALELDCCPDYQIVRQWTAIDCSGNSTVCTQTISFSADVAGTDGSEDENSNMEDALSSQHEEMVIGAAPNPTNSQTTFTFKVSKAEKTSFEILDMTGKKVADLYSGIADAGAIYNVNYDVRNLAPGVYMFRLINGFEVKIDRLIVGK